MLLLHQRAKIGTEYGNRTRVSALRGQRPWPLDELGMEPLEGFAPSTSQVETGHSVWLSYRGVKNGSGAWI